MSDETRAAGSRSQKDSGEGAAVTVRHDAAPVHGAEVPGPPLSLGLSDAIRRVERRRDAGVFLDGNEDGYMEDAAALCVVLAAAKRWAQYEGMWRAIGRLASPEPEKGGPE